MPSAPRAPKFGANKGVNAMKAARARDVAGEKKVASTRATSRKNSNGSYTKQARDKNGKFK